MLTRLKMPLVLGAVLVALAAFAFVSAGDTHTVDAVPVQQVTCEFTPSPPQLGSNTVTCTFLLHEEAHTLSVDFTIGGQPLIRIDGCTLDSEAFHAGPCP